MNKCSLIISTYNWSEALNLCLESVIQQTVLPTEVIIADDGSREDTKALIQKYQELNVLPIKHIWHPDQGFLKCIILNKAISQTSTDYIVQIDGDIILDRNFIKDHLYVAEKNCFIRGTRSHITKEYLPKLFEDKIVNFNFSSKGIKHRFNALRIPVLSWMLTKKKSDSSSVRGCNMAYWKQDFIDVNGYNNDLQGWGHEDEELAARLVNKGVLKKTVKLRCIQYHIFHPLASRESEIVHEKSIDSVKIGKVVKISNGYEEIQKDSSS